MKRETGLAETIDKVDKMVRYDRSAKKLLAFKAIDAWTSSVVLRSSLPMT